jgi:hypothetical protein
MKLRLLLSGLALFASASFVRADTLVMNDGRRLQGALLGVYGREIEFEERTGGRRRTIRISRDQIDRIEFDRGEFDRSRSDDFHNQPYSGPPRGMRERQIVVDARDPWTDTGIEVRSGQQIYFSAQGETRWGRDRRDGAGGERNSPLNPNRPMPDRPAAALIGRIGDRNEYFFIGADPGPFRARDSGRLYLGINDDVLTDNSGNLRVTVAF